MIPIIKTKPLLALTGLFLGLGSAHSWNEQLQVIGDNGSYIGDAGYPRAYYARTSPGFNDGTMTYLIPQLDTNRVKIDKTDLLCHPKQRTPSQTDNFPKLQVAPGSYVAMKYIENGHVTNPQNQKGKPKAGGTVFVYGTTQPKGDEKLIDVLAWTTDGKGGDGRGKLLAAQNYDDGRCYQLDPNSQISADRKKADPPTGNGGGIWCETDAQMPANLQAGSQYTVYWVWSWATVAGADPVYPTGKDEYYTTCNDVDVVAGPINGASTHSLPQQDGNMLAVSGYKSRTANNPAPPIDAALPGSTPASSQPTASATPSSQPPASAPLSTPAASHAGGPAGIYFGAGGSMPAYESALPTTSTFAANASTAVPSTSLAPSSLSSGAASAPTLMTSTVTTFRTVTATLPPMNIITMTAVVTTYVPAATVTATAGAKRDLAADTEREHLRMHRIGQRRSGKFALLR